MQRILFAGLLTIAAAGFAPAQEAPEPVLRSNVNSIWFDNWNGLSNAMLRVALPDGRVETIYEATRTPSFRLSGAKVDGVYIYELRAATTQTLPFDDSLPWAGPESDRPSTTAVPFQMGGIFEVLNGAVVPAAATP